MMANTAHPHIRHKLVQGSPEWLEFRAKHFGASEAAAMLGLSPKTNRDELLRLKHLGTSKEFSQFVQERVLDEGHRVEALARPLAEKFLDDDLFPVVMSCGQLSASCDGLTMDGSIAWEHKQYNRVMAEHMRATGQVPPEHMPQCQQILMVTDAKTLLFTLSDGTKENALHCWVEPDESWFNRIARGWAQFALDLVDYVLPAEAAPAPVGRTPDTLPSVVLEIRGEVVSTNLPQVKAQAIAVFEGINRDLETDQDFADAEKTVKWCKDIEERLAAAKAHAMGQAKSLDDVFRALDEIAASARAARLDLDSKVTKQKAARKDKIIADAIAAQAAEIAKANQLLGKPFMPALVGNYAGAVHGKRSLDTMRAAVNAELARVKTEIAAAVERIQANMAILKGEAHDWGFLFPDLAACVNKGIEDFANLLAARRAAHDKAEADRKAKEQAEADAKLAASRAAQDNLVAQAQAMQAAQLTAGAQARGQASTVAQGFAPTSLFDPIPAAATSAHEIPDLAIGEINERLGFSVTGDFLETLGFPPTMVRKSKLYHRGQFPAICRALIARIVAAAEVEATA